MERLDVVEGGQLGCEKFAEGGSGGIDTLEREVLLCLLEEVGSRQEESIEECWIVCP